VNFGSWNEKRVMFAPGFSGTGELCWEMAPFHS
jgi:hypothetical protein